LVINPVDGTSLSINPMSAMTDKIIYTLKENQYGQYNQD